MDKLKVKDRIEAMLEEKGKAHLKDFAEDVAEVCYEAIKIVVDESETKIDDVIIAALDKPITEFLEAIDGK